MSEFGKMLGCVVFWSLLAISSWAATRIPTQWKPEGGHEIRCFEERVFNLAVRRSLHRTRHLSLMDLRG